MNVSTLYDIYLNFWENHPEVAKKIALMVLSQTINDERYLKEKEKASFIVLDEKNLRKFFDLYIELRTKGEIDV